MNDELNLAVDGAMLPDFSWGEIIVVVDPVTGEMVCGGGGGVECGYEIPAMPVYNPDDGPSWDFETGAIPFKEIGIILPTMFAPIAYVPAELWPL